MSFEIRHATLEDAPEIARVHVASWQAAYAGLLPSSYLSSLSPAQREPTWRAQLSSPPANRNDAFVGLDGDRLAGFCDSGPAAGEPDELGELYTVYLLPEYWAMGLGQRLLEAALRALRGRGFSEAVLWVLEGNERAIRFYERNGWTFDGGRKITERGGVKAADLRYRTTVPPTQ